MTSSRKMLILAKFHLHRSSRLVVFYKREFLKFRKIHRKTPVPGSLSTLLKKSLAQVFSYGFCEIFKNTFSTEHRWCLFLLVSGSTNWWKNLWNLWKYMHLKISRLIVDEVIRFIIRCSSFYISYNSDCSSNCIVYHCF